MNNKNVFKIQKNVPVPLGALGSKYPFNELKPGNSFWVTIEDSSFEKVRSKVHTNLSWLIKTGKVPKIKICIRRDGDGVRVWRIE